MLHLVYLSEVVAHIFNTDLKKPHPVEKKAGVDLNGWLHSLKPVAVNSVVKNIVEKGAFVPLWYLD